MENRSYLSDYHRQRVEKLRKEVEEMSRHPYSYEQALEQVRKMRESSGMRA